MPFLRYLWSDPVHTCSHSFFFFICCCAFVTIRVAFHSSSSLCHKIKREASASTWFNQLSIPTIIILSNMTMKTTTAIIFLLLSVAAGKFAILNQFVIVYCSLLVPTNIWLCIVSLMPAANTTGQKMPSQVSMHAKIEVSTQLISAPRGFYNSKFLFLPWRMSNHYEFFRVLHLIVAARWLSRSLAGERNANVIGITRIMVVRLKRWVANIARR